MNQILQLKNSRFAKFAVLEPLLKWLFFIPKFEAILQKLPQTNCVHSITHSILQQMNIQVVCDEKNLNRIPITGPLIFVANHPFGGIDGIALGHIISKVRPDIKIMANFLLQRMKPIAHLFIGVNPFNHKDANTFNRRGLKEAKSWLNHNGALAVFPSGTVSHLQLKKRCVIDPSWNKTIAHLAVLHQATIIPIYFSGKNSWYFQIAGVFSTLLRTLLLPQQFFARKNKSISVKIGHPITAKELQNMYQKAQQQIDYLFERTYHLGKTHILQKEIDALPSSAKLFHLNEFEVYIATAKQIPKILNEIARLREITFRDVGEGSGHDLDLDEFDQHYLHLFIWQKQQKEIVGSYRLGLVDHASVQSYLLLAYEIDPVFFKKITPAIELGRAFIIKPYQKHLATLMLLWKGIGKFIALNPHYKTLFGVVSISQSYREESRNLIVRFLEKNAMNLELTPLIQAKSPYISIQDDFQIGDDLNQLNEIIRQQELDQKEIPILLKHYLGLNAEILAFAIDKNFGDCLDCFCLLDLNKVPLKKMYYFMGKEETEHFLRTQGESNHGTTENNRNST